MIRFDHANILHLLWVVAGLGLLFLRDGLRRNRLLAQFAHRSLLGRLSPEVSVQKRTWRSILVLSAIALAIVALAGPRWGTQLRMVQLRGVDVVLAIDTSLSMEAEDVRPNRLDRAKLELGSLIDRLQGHRLGLVVFAGSSFVQSPLTVDLSAVRMFLGLIEPGLVPEPGSDLAGAVRRALEAFPDDRATRKVVVLLTDGEDHSGEFDVALQEAAEQEVIVHTIGIGSEAGSPIPLKSEDGSVSGYKKGDDGSVVVTRLGSETLARTAAITGGIHVRARGGSDDLDPVSKAIDDLEKSELDARMAAQYEPRYQWPLGLAVALAIPALLLGDRRPGAPWRAE